MPILALTVLSLMVGGALLDRSAQSPPAQAQALASWARPVTLHPEISAPMFHGTVQSIDRASLRATIQTDYGRLVFVTMESCERLSTLRPGDRVRLDVDAQGIVRALEKTDTFRMRLPESAQSSGWPSGRCAEPVTS